MAKGEASTDSRSELFSLYLEFLRAEGAYDIEGFLAQCIMCAWAIRR